MFNKLLYCKLLIEGLQTDLSGNIYLSGTFMDTIRIDSVNYILNTGSGFNTNCFLIKLTQNGEFVWKKNIDVVYPSASKLDAIKIKDNNLFAGLLNFNEGYIKKFDLNSTELMSITQSPVGSISGIDVDGQGNIYSGGACTNGDINFADHIASTSFGYNVYLVKYNSSGNYVWSRFVEDITFQALMLHVIIRVIYLHQEIYGEVSCSAQYRHKAGNGFTTFFLLSWMLTETSFG
ncbi:MAG: hypothetical protein M3R36_15055 [Bacteroidota bacterium]|nr:hypothetical protein [Bacteroidota bacterium]